jgi:hypothetical protein
MDGERELLAEIIASLLRPRQTNAPCREPRRLRQCRRGAVRRVGGLDKPWTAANRADEDTRSPPSSFARDGRRALESRPVRACRRTARPRRCRRTAGRTPLAGAEALVPWRRTARGRRSRAGRAPLAPACRRARSKIVSLRCRFIYCLHILVQVLFNKFLKFFDFGFTGKVNVSIGKKSKNLKW